MRIYLNYDIHDVPAGFTGKYYLGSLIVNQTGANVFEVIDGQQRLTTLYLLLSFLKNGSVNNRSLRFEAREKSNKTLHDIDAIKDTKSELAKEPWYSEEIIEGYSVIKRYFEGKTEVFLKDFKEKLISVTIIRTQVPKDIDLNHYFEIMNTRGEQLELHEIVKAKIIGAIKSGDEITETDKKDKIIAAAIWDACAQMDKYVQMNFPVAKRNLMFGKNWDAFECKSFGDIRSVFMDEQYADETRFTLRSKLLNPIKSDSSKEDKDEEENEHFESIISFPNFILQVNEAMNITENDNDAGLDDKRFIELLKNNWQSREGALHFIYSLLKYRYLFDQYLIKREHAGRYRTEGRWSLKKLEMYADSKNRKKPLYKGTIGTSEDAETDGDDSGGNDNKLLRMLQACLRITYTSPKTMHWIARTMAAANAGKSGKEIISLLEKYCCNKVEEADYQKRTGLVIDRIVFTYLDYILYRDYAGEFRDFQFQFRTSIEHFFPQHPINGENAVDENNRNSFGNLALITVSANSKFSNMLPIHKVEQYKEVIEQSPKLMRMKKLLDENDRVWDDKLVVIHNEEMINMLSEEIKAHSRQK